MTEAPIAWRNHAPAVILVASTVVAIAPLTVGLGFVALVAYRYVLPAADRLEARLERRAGEGADAGTIRA